MNAQAEPLLEVRPCVRDVAPCVSPDLGSREHCSMLEVNSEISDLLWQKLIEYDSSCTQSGYL